MPRLKKHDILIGGRDLNLQKIETILLPRWQYYREFDSLAFSFVMHLSGQIPGASQNEALKYLFAYLFFDVYPFAKPKFIEALKYMPIYEDSTKHRFMEYVNILRKKPEAPLNDLLADKYKLSVSDAKNLAAKVESGNFSFYEAASKVPFDREALMAVTEQLISKGYANLDLLLKYRKEQNTFKMLIKYGEDFTFWEMGIRKIITDNVNSRQLESIQKDFHDLVHPQPLSKALFHFRHELIQLLPNDVFLYIFHSKLIQQRYGIKKADTFMRKHVIVQARENHNAMLKAIKKLHKSLKNTEKPFVSNYYIIDIDIEHALIAADAKSIPDGLKRILIQEISESGRLPNLLSTYDVYMKDLIETLPASSILMIANFDLQIVDFFRKQDKKIRGALKSVDASIKNIYEVAKLTDAKTKVVNAIHAITREDKYKGPQIPKDQLGTAVVALVDCAKKLKHLVAKGFAQ